VSLQCFFRLLNWNKGDLLLWEGKKCREGNGMEGKRRGDRERGGEEKGGNEVKRTTVCIFKFSLE